ncbi:hypothetical protein EPA93_42635 [Ktedonosporobacter rubrisoli]|uniref:Uncharacterized protein n=1 Tax=Ktedonosporobacter rubrisoli TaxID=2509675 RepID=A0A4V0Z083_KTERU|nr:hypothetical protein [Ktedonosporobacter rubrisoli]QBD82321.1 hypothetical protein EPA93_42635 [Ktedonosporobacter rubrisoli]
MSDRIPTVADLCKAIAEGHIAATLDGRVYHVNALELRRYLDRFRSFPTISTFVQRSSLAGYEYLQPNLCRSGR